PSKKHADDISIEEISVFEAQQWQEKRDDRHDRPPSAPGRSRRSLHQTYAGIGDGGQHERNPHVVDLPPSIEDRAAGNDQVCAEAPGKRTMQNEITSKEDEERRRAEKHDSPRAVGSSILTTPWFVLPLFFKHLEYLGSHQPLAERIRMRIP